MTEQAIDLDALAADLTAAGLECHIEDYSVFADTPKKRNRIQRRWRVTGFGHMFQAQFNWGEWGPNGTVLVDDWVYLDIIRSHVDPMYAKQDQPSCAPTAPAPDPVCQSCKHLKTSHTERKCHHTHVAEGPDGWQTMHCGCMGFLDVPAAEPEPAALVPRAEVKNAIEALRTDAKYFSHQCLELHRVNRRNSIADALEKLLGDGKDGAR